MASSRQTNLAFLLGAAAVLYWATLPPHSVAFDRACEIRGMQAHVSAAIHGDSFWQAQAEAAVAARQWQERLPAAVARAKEDLGANASGIEARMTRLSNPDPGSAAEQEKADAASQRLRLQEIAWLTSCESAMRTRMRH